MINLQIRRTGIVELRLAAGPVPHYREIVKLSGPIIAVLINEFGTKEVIKRFSDPLWFQCYACIVGFEWQFSGMTTVPLMAAKEALAKENLGIKVVGGKGRKSKAIKEIPSIGEQLGLSTKQIDKVNYASKLTCKVDSCELQDSHSLYWHSMLIDEKGNYVTINQKMNTQEGTVRRFHWALNPKQFVEEPYSAAVGTEQKVVLDLTSKKSKECRKAITDIVSDTKPEKVQKTILTLDRGTAQTKLMDFIKINNVKVIKLPYYLQIPKRLNLEALRIAHELGEKKFESVLGVKGVGPATVRGLAYISDLIYGTKGSFKDPIRYTFGFGTKVNIPYPVNRRAMSEAAGILKLAVDEAKIGKKEKIDALKRLRKIVPR